MAKQLTRNYHKLQVTKAALAAFLGLNISLVILDMIFSYGELIPFGPIERLFNMAREDSLAGWVSSLYLLSVGVVLWLVYLKEKTTGWRALAIFFTYLGIDDGSGLHERIGTGVKHLIKISSSDPDSAFNHFPSYTWHLVYQPVLAGMSLFMLWYVHKKFKNNHLKLMIVAGLGSLAFAETLDFLEGVKGAYDVIGLQLSLSSKFVEHFARVLEEFIENLGATIFFFAFLLHFLETTDEVSVRLK